MTRTEKLIQFAEQIPDFEYDDKVYDFLESYFLKQGI